MTVPTQVNKDEKEQSTTKTSSAHGGATMPLARGSFFPEAPPLGRVRMTCNTCGIHRELAVLYVVGLAFFSAARWT